MTNEKIVEVINNLYYLISEDCTDTQMDYSEDIEIAISALEKDVPLKTITSLDARNDEYEACPVCGKPLTEIWKFDEYKPKYCHNCGQRIDWSDENGRKI